MGNFVLLLTLICGLAALEPTVAQSRKQTEKARNGKTPRVTSQSPLEKQVEEGAPRKETEELPPAGPNARPMAHAGYCSVMNEEDFFIARTHIQKQSFEDAKLKVMRQIISAQCVTAEQVKGLMQLLTYESSKLDFAKWAVARTVGHSSVQVREIMKAFTYEDSRLQFAKHAYATTRDKGNYYLVNEGFTYSASADELNDFIAAQPH